MRAFQARGDAVAMTGDGANDAPAIRLADVGIAFGDRSTAAARHAADMVVADEGIEIIVTALLEGRALWKSVRDAVGLLVGGNLGEIGFTLIGGLLSGKSPLNARQLLLVNILTDTAPALAVAARPSSIHDPRALLLEGPESSLGEQLERDIAVRAAITTLCTSAAWGVGRLTGTESRANTVALLTLIGSQMAQTLVVGGRSKPVLVASLGSTAALVAIVQTPLSEPLLRLPSSRPAGPVGLGDRRRRRRRRDSGRRAIPAAAAERGGGSMRRAEGALFVSILVCACGSRTGVLSTDDAPADARVRDARIVDAAPTDAREPRCVCAGAMLLASSPTPTAIALDDGYVYWASAPGGCAEGTINRVPKCGGPVEEIAAHEPNPRALALDDERVYFYDACGSGRLASAPKDGSMTTIYPIGVEDSGRAMAVGPDQIYFSDYGLLEIPKSGGMQSTIDAADFVYDIETDARAVYWIGPIGGGPRFGVFTHLHGAADFSMLAMPDDVSNDLALDDDTLYFFGRGTIQRMPKAGGPVEAVAGSNHGWKMATDERFLYWTVGFSGGGGYTVNRIDKTGGEVVELGSGEGAYVDIAVDDRCVYVANLYGDEIRSFPKSL